MFYELAKIAPKFELTRVFIKFIEGKYKQDFSEVIFIQQYGYVN